MKYYIAIAKQYREAIDEILWNAEDGTWYDYNMRHNKPRRIFYPSNLTPLYTLSYNAAMAAYYGQRSVQYLRSNYITEYTGKLRWLLSTRNVICGYICVYLDV